MRIKRAIIIPAIQALSAAGSILAASVVPAMAVQEVSEQKKRRRKKDGETVTIKRERLQVLALVVRCGIELLRLIADLSGWAGGYPRHLL